MNYLFTTSYWMWHIVNSTCMLLYNLSVCIPHVIHFRTAFLVSEHNHKHADSCLMSLFMTIHNRSDNCLLEQYEVREILLCVQIHPICQKNIKQPYKVRIYGYGKSTCDALNWNCQYYNPIDGAVIIWIMLTALVHQIPDDNEDLANKRRAVLILDSVQHGLYLLILNM